jgi:glycosyltransferase involved in cell wall biosynthesis
MTVLVVGPLPPPNGGMALQTEALVRQLRGEGVTVEVVAVNAPYQPAWVGKVPVLRAGFRLLPYLWRLWRAAGRADLVHILANSGWSWFLFAVPAIRIADWRGKAIVLNYRGGLAGEFFARSFAKVRPTLARCDDLIVPTGFLQTLFHRYEQPTAIVPNIVDTELFAPRGELPGNLHIVVTRNLEALYDNAAAIRALAVVRQQQPDARLTLAGEGPERANLQQLAHQLQVAEAVHFAGRLPREQVAALLQTARVVLNPSTADNSPNSLIEAMAAGVPIVSTDVGGVPQLCQPDTHALLVPARQPDAMAAAILRLHQDDTLRARLIGAGRARAAEFGWPAVWPALQASYARARAHRSQRHA